MRTWDQTIFTRTLREYVSVSGNKTLPSIINTKGWFVARKATWFTRKADIYRIRSQLGQFVSSKFISRGKIMTKRKLTLVNSADKAAPLAALIINARRARAGQPGLYGSKMRKAIARMLAGRFRGVAFLKSGWLEAIQKLGPYAEKRGVPRADGAARRVGRPKGDAVPAVPGFKPVARIVNLATTRRDTRQALVRYGTPGLQRAFNDEAASMKDYIERRMADDARRFNRAQR